MDRLTNFDLHLCAREDTALRNSAPSHGSVSFSNSRYDCYE